MNQKIHDTIIDLIVKHFGLDKEEIRLDQSFTLDYGANPSQLTDFLADIQTTFAITLPTEELRKLTTVAQLIEVVEEMLSDW